MCDMTKMNDTVTATKRTPRAGKALAAAVEVAAEVRPHLPRKQRTVVEPAPAVVPTNEAKFPERKVQHQAIERYLNALEFAKPRRGRPRKPELLEMRLKEIGSVYSLADAVGKVTLIQERINLQRELLSIRGRTEIAEAEEAFLAVVVDYSERRGITWAAWAQAGVPLTVLKRSGLART